MGPRRFISRGMSWIEGLTRQVIEEERREEDEGGMERIAKNPDVKGGVRER